MTNAEQRERDIPILRKPPVEIPDPVLLLQGADWRIVRMTSPETGEVKDVIEAADGRDALGVVRWQAVDGNRNGVSTYMRVIRALTEQLILRVEKTDAQG